MITGFNTDIEHKGVTYHVQTEDKGPRTPMILSLVYVGGTILASRRAPYRDLLDGGSFSEKVLLERLSRQHKLFCAAIRSGRIEDLKRMTAKGASEPGTLQTSEFEDDPASSLVLEYEPPEVPLASGPIVDGTAGLVVLVERNVSVETAQEAAAAPPGSKIPKPTDGLIFEVPQVVSEPVIEEVVVVEEEMILPAEAVVILSDQISQKPVPNNKLTISLLNEIDLKSGERKTINILVGRGDAGIGLTKAHVVVKILGSTFRPLIFHAKTDSNGVAVIHVHLPNFKTGRAVLFVRAMYDGEETEFRRVISHG